jgi:hypothetical protein
MRQTTRRTLLRAGAVGLALAPLLVAPEVFAVATTRRGLYARERFTSLRRRTFRLDGATRHWRFTLTDVGNLPNVGRGDQHSFSLTFRCGSVGPEQGSYVLGRPGFRSTTLFVVPCDASRRTYRAVVFQKP